MTSARAWSDKLLSKDLWMHWGLAWMMMNHCLAWKTTHAQTRCLLLLRKRQVVLFAQTRRRRKEDDLVPTWVMRRSASVALDESPVLIPQNYKRPDLRHQHPLLFPKRKVSQESLIPNHQRKPKSRENGRRRFRKEDEFAMPPIKTMYSEHSRCLLHLPKRQVVLFVRRRLRREGDLVAARMRKSATSAPLDECLALIHQRNYSHPVPRDKYQSPFLTKIQVSQESLMPNHQGIKPKSRANREGNGGKLMMTLPQWVCQQKLLRAFMIPQANQNSWL